jgi:hypothetical protein
VVGNLAMSRRSPFSRAARQGAEGGWWTGYAADVEAHQHLRTAVREALRLRLRSAAESGERWAFNPSVHLCFMDQAWRIHLVLGPRLLPWDVRTDRVLAGEYALWLLGKGARSAPEGVEDLHRDLARYLVDCRLASDRQLQRIVRTIARTRGDPLRAWAVSRLGGLAAAEAHSLAQPSIRPIAPPTPEGRFGSVPIPATPDESTTSAELLHSIAADANDPQRCAAIRALKEAAQLGHAATLALLNDLISKPDRDAQCAALLPLIAAAHEGHEAALRALRSLAATGQAIPRHIARATLAGLAEQPTADTRPLPGDRPRSSSNSADTGPVEAVGLPSLLHHLDSGPSQLAPGQHVANAPVEATELKSDSAALETFSELKPHDLLRQILPNASYDYPTIDGLRRIYTSLPARMTSDLLNAGAEMLIDVGLAETELSLALANMLNVANLRWVPDRRVAERLGELCLDAFKRDDPALFHLAGSVGFALAWKAHPRAHLRYLELGVRDPERRALDFLRISAYYGSPGTLIAGITRHLHDPLRNPLLQAHDLGRVLSLLEDSEVPGTSILPLVETTLKRLRLAGLDDLAEQAWRSFVRVGPARRGLRLGG